MAEFAVSELMKKKLDSFLAEKTCTDIDRSKFIPFVLKDVVNNLTTCFMFNCNGHSYEDETIVPCKYTGCVIYINAFWLEVPKELAYTYLLELLSDLYTTGIYRDWKNSGYIGGNTSDGSGSSSGGGCGCPRVDSEWHEVNV